MGFAMILATILALALALTRALSIRRPGRLGHPGLGSSRLRCALVRGARRPRRRRDRLRLRRAARFRSARPAARRRTRAMRVVREVYGVRAEWRFLCRCGRRRALGRGSCRPDGPAQQLRDQQHDQRYKDDRARQSFFHRVFHNGDGTASIKRARRLHVSRLRCELAAKRALAISIPEATRAPGPPCKPTRTPGRGLLPGRSRALLRTPLPRTAQA